MDLCKKYMALAIKKAKQAAKQNEIPVGAVLVSDETGEILTTTYNMCEKKHDPTAHAEMIAIRKASKKQKYLQGCTLYISLEPCPMCAAALIHSRISKVVYAAKDPRQGAFGSLINLNAYPLESHPIIEQGEYEKESVKLLQEFFKNRR